ncbi:phosphate acetyltransferase [Flaviflexus massiliensis]|uniref:phosphate acetyltransferase n=1 Tax=Flaviflexus massiliensis TaxID=1522309 RepID=UPI0006D540B6|nr:phosphate acetyltransferase [Flaviflexus massiliensis]
MADSLYLASTEQVTGGIEIARQIVDILRTSYDRVGVFRPYVNGPAELDPVVQEFGAGYGTRRDHYFEDEASAMNAIIRAYRKFSTDYDAVLLVGHTEGDPVNPGLIGRSGRTAANLGTTIGMVVDGSRRSVERTAGYIELAAAEMSAAHVPITSVFVLNPQEGLEAEIHDDHPEIKVYSGKIDESILEVFKEKPAIRPPLMFQTDLMERARIDRKRVVLPESGDDRVLQAASIILSNDVSDIVLVGKEEEVLNRAKEKGYDLSGAQIVDPDDESYISRYAPELARLRAKKGMTEEQAVEKLKDVSYFATMMVHMGDADGMVSGAAHTTAETIVPSFQIIKTKPDTSIVSSVFLMLMSDRVLVYGDCAVNTNPTPQQLADITVSSAQTAVQFGVDPRIALLSYSTGASGTGADVEAVIEATNLARAKNPDLLIEGPIQYDAAVDPHVARKKMPDSPVAGKANVFIFPSLNAGNIGYKAVQRSSGVVAVGPILQGLNKPVNDLSRGALVDDIVNTIAITAVQAQN